MKRVIGILLLVMSICVLTVSMSACGVDDNGDYLDLKGVDQSGYIPEEVTIDVISVLADPIGNYTVVMELNGEVFERAMSTKAGQYVYLIDTVPVETYQVKFEGSWYSYHKENNRWMATDAEESMQDGLAALGALFDPEKYVQQGDRYYYTGESINVEDDVYITVQDVTIEEGKLIISLMETFRGRFVSMNFIVSDFGTTRISFPNNLPKPARA